MSPSVLASIGLGTGRLPVTNEPDVVRRNADVVRTALEGGITLIDCASNYGGGASEMIVGCVLTDMLAEGALERNAVTICSKGGYSSDSATHSLASDDLSRSLDQSIRHLQLDYLDIYFVHNPEDALATMTRAGFEVTMLRAFEMLEDAVERGRIRGYGIATAEGLRVTGPVFHELGDFVRWAERVAGTAHHLVAVQMPFSIGQPEALLSELHNVNGEVKSAIAAAKALGLTVIASAALNRMNLPESVLDVLARHDRAGKSRAALALDFVRAVDGIDYALFGTSNPEHVTDMLSAAASVRPISSRTH